MAAKISSAGTHCQHISNNAPRDICDLDPEKRKSGVEIAKKWIDGAKILGAKSMRVNAGVAISGLLLRAVKTANQELACRESLDKAHRALAARATPHNRDPGGALIAN